MTTAAEKTPKKRAPRSKKVTAAEAEAPLHAAHLATKPPVAYSFSRLTTYDRCSKLYEYTYVLRLDDIRQDTLATRLGGFCHTALEDFYGDETDTIDNPYHALVRDGGVWDNELAACGLSMLKGDLQRYAAHITRLYERASASYKGPDAIRKADGGVATAPHLTGTWKQYVRQHGLDQLAGRLDRAAAQAGPRWQGISISDCYAQTAGILWGYENPKEIQQVVAIELAVSEVLYQAADAEGNPLVDAAGKPVATTMNRGPHRPYRNAQGERVYLETLRPANLPMLDRETGKVAKDAEGRVIWNPDALFNGYIDLIARDAKGRLIIIDHKTSAGEPPSPDKIARHEQLLAYGFIVYHLTGEMPYAIGINHLRSSRLITAPFDMERAEKAMSRLIRLQDAIERKVFLEQDPDGYMSMCVIKSYKDNTYKLCPGLKFCHPDVYKQHTDHIEDSLFD